MNNLWRFHVEVPFTLLYFVADEFGGHQNPHEDERSNDVSQMIVLDRDFLDHSVQKQVAKHIMLFLGGDLLWGVSFRVSHLSDVESKQVSVMK